MNTPAPMPPPGPTPQAAPTVGGMIQGAATALLAAKGLAFLGLDSNVALGVAGTVVSAITSWFHRIAQKNHWSF